MYEACRFLVLGRFCLLVYIVVETERLEFRFWQFLGLKVEGPLWGTDGEQRYGGIGSVELAVEAATIGVAAC